jgi:hypothetical protein
MIVYPKMNHHSKESLEFMHNIIGLPIAINDVEGKSMTKFASK